MKSNFRFAFKIQHGNECGDRSNTDGRTGFQIDRGKDGIRYVSAIEQKPAGTYDLILMDIQMPNMGGYKATQIIRGFSDKEKANIPIVAMTANAFEEDTKRALSVGMNAHIAKPIDMKKV